MTKTTKRRRATGATSPNTDWAKLSFDYQRCLTGRLAAELAADTASDVETIRALGVGHCQANGLYSLPLVASNGEASGVALFDVNGRLEVLGRGLGVPADLNCADRTLWACEHPADLLLLRSWRQQAICCPAPVESRLSLALAETAWRPRGVVFLLSGMKTPMRNDRRLRKALGALECPVKIVEPLVAQSFAAQAAATSRGEAMRDLPELVRQAPMLGRTSVVTALNELSGIGPGVRQLFDFAA